MVKLPVRLLALIMLGTISRCEEAAGLYPDSVAIVSPSSSSSSFTTLKSNCRKSSMSVRFYDIIVKGSDSDVAYRRTIVGNSNLEFATNTTVALPSSHLLECAKAAANADMEAFEYDGTCTGYKLDKHFLKCQKGDVVLFVRVDNLDDVPVVVPIDEAPYKLVDIGGSQDYRQYMLTAPVLTKTSFSYRTTTDSGPALENYLSFFSVITPENEESVLAGHALLDMNYCLTDGAYGLPIFVSTEFYDITWPIIYFFDHCGKTIEVPVTDDYIIMQVFSHEGYGCTNFYSEASDECTVTFKRNESITVDMEILFSEPEEKCAGFNVTYTKSSNQGVESETGDACPEVNTGASQKFDSLTISVLEPPLKPTAGFYIIFY